MGLKYPSTLLLAGTVITSSLPVIAIYAAFCFVLAGFAHWILPPIIAAAYPILNWGLHSGSSLPVDHYLDRWSVISRTLQLAAMLHLIIILFIRAIDSKRSSSPIEIERANSQINLVLIVFSAAFLTVSILSQARGDYNAYIREWTDLLGGFDPWTWIIDLTFTHYGNAYGPLFNVLAPLLWFTPLASKLLFSFTYIVYVIWLIKDFGADRGLVALSWPVIVFWLVNPFAWVEIAFFGHFDVLVALACVAAVHGRVRDKDVFAGVCLALGILLKFLPIVILPFLAFDRRRFHFILFTSCAALIIASLCVSVLVWGNATFAPLIFASSRSSIASIYQIGSLVGSPRHLFPNAAHWLEKPLLLTAGLGVFTWSMVYKIGPALSAVLAILVTLQFYRVGYINYQMVLFSLVSYWAISEWKYLQEHSILSALLVGYFGFLAIVDGAIALGLEEYGSYSLVTVLCKSVLGFALLASLLTHQAIQTVSGTAGEVRTRRQSRDTGSGPGSA